MTKKIFDDKKNFFWEVSVPYLDILDLASSISEPDSAFLSYFDKKVLTYFNVF